MNDDDTDAAWNQVEQEIQLGEEERIEFEAWLDQVDRQRQEDEKWKAHQYH